MINKIDLGFFPGKKIKNIRDKIVIIIPVLLLIFNVQNIAIPNNKIENILRFLSEFDIFLREENW
jgi:hypothetical protein